MGLGRSHRAVFAGWLTLSLIPGAVTAAGKATHEIVAGHRATMRVPVDFDTSAVSVSLVPGGAVQRATLAVPHAVKRTSVATQQIWLGLADGSVASLRTDAAQPTLDFLPTTHTSEQRRALSLLHVQGNRMYVADSNQSVWVHDATSGNLLAPQPVFATSSSIVDLQSTDTTLFVALADGVLWSVDVSQPEAPVRLTQMTLPHMPRRLVLFDHWLCIAHEEGVSVLDVTAPGAPAFRSAYRVPEGGIHELAVADSLLLAAAGVHGIIVLELGEDGTLHWRSSHQATGDARRIASNGALAAAANLRGEVLVLDVSMPNLPSIIQALPATPDISGLGFVGNTLAIASAQTVTVWDVSASPPRFSNDAFNAGEGINFGGQRKGQLVGHRLYVADWFSGIHIYDVSLPRQPRLLSSYHTPGSPKGVVVKNDFAFIADDDHGLQVVNVRNPRAPTFVASLQTEGLAYTPVIAQDGKLYLASHRGGFQIIDITHPDAPQVLGQIDTPGKAWSIAVSGHIAYVADAEAGLLIFDVHDSGQPLLVGQFSPGGNAEDVAVEGDTAYVAFFDDGLYELDVSDPAAPQVRAHLNTPGNARGLEKVGHHLFVADWFAGLHVVDVQEPGRPQLRASYDTPGAAWGVRVAGDQAFVFDWWGGLLVLDVSDPLSPRWLADYNQSTRVRALAARGRYLFAAQGERGLQVFDINNPLNPTWTTGLELAGFAHDVALTNGHAVVAAGDRGLVVVDVSDPFRPREIETLRLPLGATRVKLDSDSGIVIDEQGGVAQVKLDKAGHVRLAAYASLQWRDGVMINNAIYGITRGGDLVAAHTNPPRGTWQTLPLDYTATHIAGNAAWLALAGEDAKLRFYDTPVLDAKPKATLDIGSAISALAVEGRTLFVGLAEGGVIVVDVSPAHPIAVLGQYPARHPLSALLFHERHVYGGGSYLWAMSPLPRVTSAVAAPQALELSLPPTLPEGSYHLQFHGDGLDKRQDNAVTVTSPMRRASGLQHATP